MTNQPAWKCIANLGDANPIEYDGLFVSIDTTGVYPPEMEYLIAPDGDVTHWEAYRTCLDRCTFREGILSDNKFHPDYAAWFAKDLGSVAENCDTDELELINQLCSEDPMDRAQGYRAIGDYHGWANLDSYPRTFNLRLEVKQRYAKALRELAKAEK